MAGIGLLVVAGVLIAVDSSSDDERDGDVIAACEASNEEVATAHRALLDDNDAPGAVEGFLGDAFVDLARDRSASIRATSPDDEVLAVLEDFDAVVDDIEADPSIGVGRDPFEVVDRQWAELGLGECDFGGGTVAGG